MRQSALLLLGLIALSPSQPNVTTASPTPQTPFATRATAIVVDVVVRDREGAPVLDLKPEDFELFEDELRQTIGAVELVTPGDLPTSRRTAAGQAVAERPAPSASGAAVAGPTVVAIVFHRLSPEARASAHQAALAYLDAERRSDYAGVFFIDSGLETIQTYTSNRTRLKAAIEEVGRRVASSHSRTPLGTSGGPWGDRDPSMAPTAGAEHVGRPLREPGFTPEIADGDPAEQKLRKMAERMQESFAELSENQQGHATVNGLLALVGSLAALPGRKTVVLFAEGLSLPPAVLARFQSVVDLANHSNVSVYTIDAAGLRVQSHQAATARGIAGIGREGVGDVSDESRTLDTISSDPLTRSLERNEVLLRQDPAVGLTLLARRTGGFFVNHTNDLRAAFQRIDSDRRFHYLLTYAPTNARLDRTQRNIRVTVRRRNVEVRARSGYVASPALATIPTLTFEAGPLAALDRTPRPTQITVTGTAIRFPAPGKSTRLALLVTVPPNQVTYRIDDASATYSADFAVLARILDGLGEPVRKGSQPYLVSGPAKDVEQARNGAILFYRQPELPPGRYTVEYAVHDAIRGAAGTGSSTVVIDDTPSGRLAVSDLVIVARAERVDGADAANPLAVGDLLLYPWLGPMRKASSTTLTFFYTAYTQGRPISGLLELRQGDRSLATLPVAPPVPDSGGRVQHVARIPITALAEGRYELRLSINDGVSEQVRSAEFALVP